MLEVFALIQASIPVELFVSLFIGSFIMVIIGFIKSSPALVLTAGIIVVTLGVVVSQVKMGDLVTKSVYNSATATTTYTYQDSNFAFTNIIQVIFVLIGAIFCIFSFGVYSSKNG